MQMRTLCSGKRGLSQHVRSAKCNNIDTQNSTVLDEKDDRKELKETKGGKESARARRANAAAEAKQDAKAAAPLQPVLAPTTRITSQMIAELGPAADKVQPEIRHRYSKIIAEICRAMLQAARIGDFDLEQRCLMFMVYSNAFLLSRKFGGNRSRTRRAQAYEAFEQAQDQAGLKTALQMPQQQQQQQNQTQTTQLDLSIRRAIELLESGFISRATKRMGQKGLANPTDPEVKQKMRALHPQNSQQMPACPANAPEVLLDKTEIALAIRSMAAKGSAAGADKMTAQHLSTLIANETCLQAVTLICNRIANGKYTGDARELVTDTRGIELLKETGGIRPIAIGQTLTRIAAQRAFERDRAEWIKAAGPHQLGLGKTAGVEASVFITQNALDQGMAVLELDLENAFNRKSREQILRTVYSNPALANSWRLFDLKYGKPTRILIQDKEGKIVDMIQSCEGVTQGCNLGSPGFDAAEAPELAELATRNPTCEVIAIHDDVKVIGPLDHLPKAFSDWKDITARSNGKLNGSKSKVHYYADEPPSQEALNALQSEGVKLVRQASSIAGGITATAAQHAELEAQPLRLEHEQFLQQLQHPKLPRQHASIMLRSSGVAKFNYLTRATRPDLLRQTYKWVDESNREAFAQKSEVKLKDDSAAATQVQLPKKMGGFGIRPYELLADAAWFAAQAQAAPLLSKSQYESSQQSDEARARMLSDFKELIKVCDKETSTLADCLPTEAKSFTQFYTAEPRNAPGLQAKLSSLILNQVKMNWRVNHPEEANRLDSVATAESSAWIDAIPSSPARRILDEDWTIAVKKRLGQRSYNGPVPTTCCLCKADLTKDRDPTWHPLSCKHLIPTMANRRHNKINRTIKVHAEPMEAAVAAEYRPPCSESKKRIDADVLIPGVGAVLIDVSVRRAEAASRSGSSEKMFKDAERDKINKYKDMAKDRSAEVLPFIIDEYGRFGPAAHSFLDKLMASAAGSEARDQSTQSAAQAKRALLEDLAIAIQQQNAAMTRAVTNSWLRNLAQPIADPALAAARANAHDEATAMDLNEH